MRRLFLSGAILFHRTSIIALILLHEISRGSVTRWGKPIRRAWPLLRRRVVFENGTTTLRVDFSIKLGSILLERLLVKGSIGWTLSKHLMLSHIEKQLLISLWHRCYCIVWILMFMFLILLHPSLVLYHIVVFLCDLGQVTPSAITTSRYSPSTCDRHPVTLLWWFSLNPCILSPCNCIEILALSQLGQIRWSSCPDSW